MQPITLPHETLEPGHLFAGRQSSMNAWRLPLLFGQDEITECYHPPGQVGQGKSLICPQARAAIALLNMPVIAWIRNRIITWTTPEKITSQPWLMQDTIGSFRTLKHGSGGLEREWLLSKLHSAAQTTQEARTALDELNQFSNPYLPTEGKYTDDFFQEQWNNERTYHLETTRSYQEKQKKELGWLLCLEEQLEQEWSREGLSVAQGLARANVVSRITENILTQRAKVGDPTMLQNLTVPQQDKLLQIWYLKTDLRHKFLALIKEKRPLVRVCRPGEQTTLGIRHLAALNRGVEERRRLGWEVRQAMRWALAQHVELSDLIDRMATSLGTNHKWDTIAQFGDAELWQEWMEQVEKIKTSPLSIIPGNIITNNTTAEEPNLRPVLDRDEDNHQAGHIDGDERDEDDIADERYIQDISQIVNETMIEQLANDTLDLDGTEDMNL
ncbi:hypothetical protein PtB15_11B678 [Puccinia triticina]|nr:hypothetical protein PtB15_11B678 [Puccinia triticina]